MVCRVPLTGNAGALSGNETEQETRRARRWFFPEMPLTHERKRHERERLDPLEDAHGRGQRREGTCICTPEERSPT